MGAAGRIADDDADCFTLKVGSLRRSVIAPEQCENKQQAGLFHIASSARSKNATINPFDISQKTYGVILPRVFSGAGQLQVAGRSPLWLVIRDPRPPQGRQAIPSFSSQLKTPGP